MITRSVRLTSWLPVLAAAVLLFIQIFSPSRAIMFMLVILLGLIGVSYVWIRQLSEGVYLERQRRHGWAQVGDLIEERWIMHNESWVPVLWAEVKETSDLVGYDASRAVGLGIRQSARWMTRGTCQRRGVYTLGPLTVTMGDPFGLFRVQILHDYVDTFVIFPPLATLPPLVTPRGSARGSGRVNRRSLDLTTNASSVRPYVPGDALNRIHWRSTARRSTSEREDFQVKEYDLEPSGDLWIILDMEQRVHAGEGIESTEEYGVVTAASLANQLLRENHAVGLITHGGQQPIILPPQKSHQQLWEILRVLAGLHAESALPLEGLMEMLEPVAGRGMSAVVITPSLDAAWLEGLTALMRHGIYATAILLDAPSFGAPGELKGLRGALADLGVLSHTIAKGFRFAQITQRRRYDPEFKVMGTGRAVMVNQGERAEWTPVGAGQAGER